MPLSNQICPIKGHDRDAYAKTILKIAKSEELRQ